MKCSRVRDTLTAGGPATPEPVELHLRKCAPCRRFAEEAAAFRAELRRHRTVVEPDGAFSARVLERLPRRNRDQAVDLLGWAALRLLPLALALAVVLGGWSLLSSPSPETLLTSVDQDPIAWALGEEAGGS